MDRKKSLSDAIKLEAMRSYAKLVTSVMATDISNYAVCLR